MARASDINGTLKGRWNSLTPHEDQLAYIDDLTGLFNYRLLGELLEDRWDELTSNTDCFSLVMIDLDLFKQVNDRYGHLSGDDVLRETAQILRAHFREDDLVFRYGGDEFAVLLPGAGADAAELLGERARQAMMAHEFFSVEEARRIDVPLSFCIGVASHPDDGNDGVALIHRADQRLYEEKQRTKRHQRRRKHLYFGALSLAALISIPLGLAYFLSDLDTVSPPPDRSDGPSGVRRLSPEMEKERQQLLDQIEQLQNDVNELRRFRNAESSTTEPVETPEEISALEGRIEELTGQLESRKLVTEPLREPVVTAESIDPSVETPPPVPAAPVPAPDREEPAATVPAPIVRFAPPRLSGPINADYPRVARHLGKEATIDLIVLVNEAGRVIHARTVSPRVGFGFEKAALDAALATRWSPGTRDGSPVESEASLRVSFKMPR